MLFHRSGAPDTTDDPNPEAEGSYGPGTTLPPLNIGGINVEKYMKMPLSKVRVVFELHAFL